MVLPFTIIRKFSGGYHAGNINYCLVGSCCILAFCIKITTIIKSGLGLSIITLCAIISLCINSPIEHENHTLDINEKQVYAKLARYITLSFGIISVILCKLQKEWICNLYFYWTNSHSGITNSMFTPKKIH